MIYSLNNKLERFLLNTQVQNQIEITSEPKEDKEKLSIISQINNFIFEIIESRFNQSIQSLKDRIIFLEKQIIAKNKQRSKSLERVIDSKSLKLEILEDLEEKIMKNFSEMEKKRTNVIDLNVKENKNKRNLLKPLSLNNFFGLFKNDENNKINHLNNNVKIENNKENYKNLLEEIEKIQKITKNNDEKINKLKEEYQCIKLK